MRKNILSLIIIFTCFQVNSQTFIQENKQWSYAKFPSIGNSITTTVFKLTKDTLIHAKTYKTVLKSHDENLQIWEESNYFLREEMQKIFCYNSNTEIEDLLYDFAINEGDSLYVERFGFKIHVDSIRNIGLIKYYYFSKNNQKTVWIENIGSMDNLFYPTGNIDLIGEQNILLCCSINNNYLFQNTEYTNCFLSTEINKINNLEIIVYPNPFCDFIHISSEISIKKYELIDSQGIVIQVGTQHEMNTKDLLNGIYILKIEKEDNKILYIKILK